MVNTYYKQIASKLDVKRRVRNADGRRTAQESREGSDVHPTSTDNQPPSTEQEDEDDDPRESPRDRITSSEIRLLKLYPGNSEDDLVANIEVYGFSFGVNANRGERESGGKTPRTIAKQMPPGFKYEALSYTWGGKEKVGAIQILEGDKRFEIKIGKNLMSALRRLRHPPRVKSRDGGQDILRDMARAHPEIAFENVRQQINHNSEGTTALNYLCIILPGVDQKKLKEFIEDTRTSKPKSPEEIKCIAELKQLLKSDPEEDEDESLVRWLWIDAICIDQDDHDEKSRQIPRMSDIYMRATNVCVWLGELEEHTDSKNWHADSSLAMDFVDEVVNNWDDVDKLLDHKEQKWSSFITLIRRPWFSRRWIVQEITRAKQATLYCGQKCVKWDKFADVVSLLRQYQVQLQDIFKRSVQLGNDPERMGDLDELSAIRLVHASDHLFRRDKDEGISEKLLPLEGLMSTLTAFEASEPKDVVYAIVWLAHDAVPVSKDAFTLSYGLVAEAEDIVDQVERMSRLPSPTTSPPLGPSIPTGSETLDLSRVDVGLTRTNVGLGVSQPENHEMDYTTIPSIFIAESDHQDVIPTNASHMPALQPRYSPSPKRSRDAHSDEDNDSLTAEAKRRMKKLKVTDMTPAEFLNRYTSLRNLMSMLKYKRFIINYEKSLFDICYDFLRFCIDRSGRLDLLVRPWAPEPDNGELRESGQLPTWIRRTSQHGAFSKLYGGPMERINADPLVGRPGTNEKRFYTADRSIRATFKTIWDKDQVRTQKRAGHERKAGDEEAEKNVISITQDWMRLEIPKHDHTSRQQKRCLIVRGFVIDCISHVHPAAIGGTIPVEWLTAANWTDATKYQPEESFWRMLVGNRDLSGDRAPASWKRACQQVFKKRAPGGDLNIKRQLLQSSLSEPTRLFLKRLESMVFRRSLLELRYDKMYREEEEKEHKREQEEREKEVRTRWEAQRRNQSFPGTPHRSFTGSPRLAPTSTYIIQKSKEEDTKTIKEDNKLALGPCDAQVGDIIAIIFGCSVPVVLRKVEKDDSPDRPPWSWRPAKYDFQLPRKPPERPDHETAEQQEKRKAEEAAEMQEEEERLEPDRFQLIGECYVHEKMDGEAWKMPNIWCEIRKFTIV